MLPVVIDVFFNLIAYWILIFIMQYICSAHMTLNRKNMILCTAINIPVHIIFMKYPEICVPLLIVLTVLLFSSKKGKDLLLFFPAFAIYLVLTIIPEAMLNVLLPTLQTDYLIGNYPLNPVALIIDITLMILLVLLRHVLLKYETTVRLSPKEILGCFGLLFFSLVDGILLVAANYSQMRLSFQYIWKAVFVGAFIFCVGYFLFSIIESRIRLYRQALSRNETEYLRVQLDSLQDIKENEEQVKHLRHDLSNHLAVIQSLCDEGNYDEIRKYTERLRGDIVLTGSDVLSGNKVADLVIHSKLKEAHEHGIEFTFQGSLANITMLDAPDICGLLANAYDNAIEACLSQEHPYIHTKVSATRNYTVIQITNSVPHKIPIRGNHVSTSKGDKSAHGYGIDIMKRIAQKYNGSCTLSSSDNEFSIKIVLLTN